MSKSFSRKIQVGDRIRHFGSGFGTISAIKKGLLKYEIVWDGGKTETYTQKEFNKWCEVVVNEVHFEPQTHEQQTIDFTTKPCSNNSTSAPGLERDSLLLESNSDNLNSLDSANETNIAEMSLISDSQKSIFTGMCDRFQNKSSVTTSNQQGLTLLQVAPRASHSQFKESDSELPTSEIASQQSLKQSAQSSQGFSQSKTCRDSSAVDTSQEAINLTLDSCSANFPAAGTMSNGSLYPADTLEPPSAESGYFWLESPSALSSLSKRPPGLSRLEDQLKKLNILKKGECLNPMWLEAWFCLPPDWTNPLELRAATELLELGEQPSETPLIGELQQLDLSESSTSIPLCKSECPGWDSKLSTVGKHFYCDLYEVVVTVINENLITIEGQTYFSAKGVEVRPWWSVPRGETFWVDRSELEEIKEFSCFLQQPPIEDIAAACLALSEIRRDGGTQPRAKLDLNHVATLVEVLEDGELDPVTVFYDGESYWLADGFHRCKAHEDFGQEEINCVITQGTRRDAVLFSVGANAEHKAVKPRSREDKRRAVTMLLNDPEWSMWSDREIARQCKVSQPFVSALKKTLTDNVISESQVTYTTKHGTTTKMRTGNIGRGETKEESESVVDTPPPSSPPPSTVTEANDYLIGFISNIEEMSVGQLEEAQRRIDQRLNRRSADAVRLSGSAELTVEASPSKPHGSQSEVDQLKAQFEAIANERDQLKTEVEAIANERDQLKTEVEALLQEIQSLKSRTTRRRKT